MNGSATSTAQNIDHPCLRLSYACASSPLFYFRFGFFITNHPRLCSPGTHTHQSPFVDITSTINRSTKHISVRTITNTKSLSYSGCLSFPFESFLAVFPNKESTRPMTQKQKIQLNVQLRKHVNINSQHILQNIGLPLHERSVWCIEAGAAVHMHPPKFASVLKHLHYQ